MCVPRIKLSKTQKGVRNVGRRTAARALGVAWQRSLIETAAFYLPEKQPRRNRAAGFVVRAGP